MEDENVKKKGPKVMNPFVPLLIIIVACAIVSYFVPGGAYERTKVNGVTTVIATSYHAMAKKPASILQIFQSIPEGLIATSAMMFCVMLIGGVIEVYKRTHVMDALINKIIKVSKGGSLTVVAGVMIIFFIFGGILGWSEHIIPFVPVVISLMLTMGYDSLVGMAVSGFACLISFAVAPFNMFTVGISHMIAELPMFSGWQFRFVCLGIICTLSLWWVLRYAAKIKQHPELSLMKDFDTTDLIMPLDETITIDGRKLISLLAMLVAFIATTYGLLNLKWGFKEMSAVFLMAGVVTAFINKVEIEDAINMIIDGMKGAIAGAGIIGVARGIQWIMGETNLVDPLVHSLSQFMEGSSAYITASSMFIVNFFINALIPSGSGQAMAVMPIMIPLADLLHISRQTAVMAFQFGDGISNTLWFTNGTLLIYLSLAKVPLKVWYKFCWPLQIMFFVVEFVMLYVAVLINL